MIADGIQKLKTGNYNKKLVDFICSLVNPDFEKRPNIYQVLDNEWLNEGKEELKFLSKVNEGFSKKKLLELQKFDAEKDFINRKRNLKRESVTNTKNKKFKIRKYVRNTKTYNETKVKSNSKIGNSISKEASTSRCQTEDENDQILEY